MSKQHTIRRWLTGGLVIAAASLPAAAQARPEMEGAPGWSPPPATPASAQPTGADGGSGFQWDDAGVGAAVSVALLGGGAAGAGLARRRRARSPVVS